MGLGAVVAAAAAVGVALIAGAGMLAVGRPVVVGAAPRFVSLHRFARVWMRGWGHGQPTCG